MSRKKSRSSGFEIILLTPPFCVQGTQRLYGAFVTRYSGANRPGFAPDSLFSHSLWLRALFCERYHYMWYTGQRTAQYVGDFGPKGQGTFRRICSLQSAKYIRPSVYDGAGHYPKDCDGNWEGSSRAK